MSRTAGAGAPERLEEGARDEEVLIEERRLALRHERGGLGDRRGRPTISRAIASRRSCV